MRSALFWRKIETPRAMSAYKLPSVSPLTVRSKNRLQSTKRALGSHKRSAAHRMTGRTHLRRLGRSSLPDRVEGLPVRLVDAELVRRGEIAVAVEAKRHADHRPRSRDPRRPDGPPHLGAGRAAVRTRLV